MTNIFNGTPHSINVFTMDDVIFDASIRKHVIKDGAQPFLVLPSNGMLNAKLVDQDAGVIAGVSVVTTVVDTVDSLPDGFDYYIVSALYVTAVQRLGMHTDKLLTVRNPVYVDGGTKVVGCLAFMAQ